MKCPKCNYISFDFNRTCPKCGNDNTGEQTRLKLSSNKPNPPFFLASLIGMENSSNFEIPTNKPDIPFSGNAPEELDARELLIALDDLETDDPKPDSLEPPDQAEDEIVFELNSIPEAEESASLGRDPLDKKGLWDGDDPDENLGTLELYETLGEQQDVFLEDLPNPINEVDLFLAEDSPPIEMPSEEIKISGTMDTPEEPDAHELTSLDDLPGDELTPEPLASSQPIEDGIAFELDDPFEQESQPAEKDALDEKGFWNSDEMDEQMTAFGLEETREGTTDVVLEETFDEKKNEELLLDLDLEPLDLELSFEDTEKKTQ